MKADTPTSAVNKSVRTTTTRALFKQYSLSHSTFARDFMEDILIGDRIRDNYIHKLRRHEISLEVASQATMNRLFLSKSEVIHLSEEEIARLSNE
jgi:hypothetical protein